MSTRKKKENKIEFPNPNFKTYLFEYTLFECQEYKNIVLVLDNNGLFGIWQRLITETDNGTHEEIWRLPYGCEMPK